MDTTLLHLISRNWGWVMLRGIVSILFGLMAFSWPLLTLHILVLIYGGYALIDGVISLIAAFKGGSPMPRWWLVVIGLVGIGAGITILLWPGISALALLIFIGVTAIVRGLFEIAGAIALRKQIENEWLMVFAGLASVLFGLVVLIHPGGGAVAMVWLIASFAVAFGLILVLLALRLKKHAKSSHH